LIPFQEFRDGLWKTMQEADFVIIPEDLQNYAIFFPCPLQRHGAKEMEAFLNSPDCPRYAIRETLNDCGYGLMRDCNPPRSLGLDCKGDSGPRLLLLERLQPEDSSEGCRLLPRPYRGGTRDSMP